MEFKSLLNPHLLSEITDTISKAQKLPSTQDLLKPIGVITAMPANEDSVPKKEIDNYHSLQPTKSTSTKRLRKSKSNFGHELLLGVCITFICMILRDYGIPHVISFISKTLN